jgi:subtilase family serine protease
MPGQFRSAYGVAAQVAAGQSGQGVTVAIVDAYASPTLLSDVQTYFRAADPSHPLTSSQFTSLYPAGYDHATLCAANTWYTEQTIDVTAVHAVAPGAHILYVAGSNCLNNGLLPAVGKIVDGHLAQVVTDSWGDNAGDLLDPPSTKVAFDDLFLLAAGTGVSVLFASGDNGDQFSTVGVTAADFPPSSPFDTAVGGTTLQIGSQSQRLGELGWSTYRSYLCTPVLFGAPGCSKATVDTWLAPTADGGAGGGTSYIYTQPWYQAGIVPSSMALENSPAFGTKPMRVVPDIAMDADPATGILMGQTQTFPDGTYWATTRYGGTSLASPLFAGVIALADQASGTALGFLNPALYKLDTSHPSTLFDVVPGGKQSQARVDYANLFDNSAGLLHSTRLIAYEGVETYCNGSGNCASRANTLVTAPGYDNMTGVGTPGTGFVSALAKQ